MSDGQPISIAVRCNGDIVKRVDRPIRWSPDGRPVVRFRKEYHLVQDDRSIELCSHKATIPKKEVCFERPHSEKGPGSQTNDDPCSEFPGPGDWTEEQLHIIEQPVSARLIVQAPPGSGKTAVACARVAHLINQGLNPSSVWMVSFTRTAVRELRDRITCLLDQNRRVAGVWIATLDSNAWYLRTGFSEQESLVPGKYDEGIRQTIELIESGHADLLESLCNVRHVVVDEAQDLVTDRARLIESLFRAFPDSTGLTVFTDPAQAIYGFTEDETADASEQLPLPMRLEVDENLGFELVELHEIHRSADQRIRELVSLLRSIAIDEGRSPADKYAAVRERIEAFEGEEQPKPSKLDEVLTDGDRDTLVLFRKRADVLRASAFLTGSDTSHRLRLSNRRSVVHPWVGILFWDLTEPWLSEIGFESRWSERLPLVLPGMPSRSDAWKLLMRIAGDRSGRVKMSRLREQLSRKKPPIEFVLPEFGFEGPILSTIHASKGREARRVILFLPREWEDQDGRADTDWGEEARVLVVGATRQRTTLDVGRSFNYAGRGLETADGRSGRVFKVNVKNSKKWYGASVEVGLEGDLVEGSPVCRSYQSGADAAMVQRQLTASATAGLLRIIARAPGQDDWIRRLHLLDDEGGELGCIGALGERLNNDLFSIGEFVTERVRRTKNKDVRKTRPSTVIKHLVAYGAGTGVLPEEHYILGELYSPWRESGFYLSPLLSCYPLVYFYDY